MTKTILEAIAELEEMVIVYERSYDEWDKKYWQNGLEDPGDFLKDVTDPYDYLGEWEVSEDPSGEVYINAIAYLEDGKPRLWLWAKDTH